MDNGTLLFLLKGGHLSMPDRIACGAWPHPPLSFAAVANYLATVLEQNGAWFPYQWEPHREGQPVREGGTIERQNNDRYVYRSAAAHPVSPMGEHHPHAVTRHAREVRMCSYSVRPPKGLWRGCGKGWSGGAQGTR